MNKPAIPKAPSCDDFDPNAATYDQALDKILSSVDQVSGTEMVATRDALNRVLAIDVVSPINVPAYTNSAMDGYAVCSDDLPAEGTASLAIKGTVFAGSPLEHDIKPGECARIMTGGKMPQGADTVIMQELVEVTDNTITFTAGHSKGQYVRPAGGDLAIGDIIFAAGKLLTAADIGMLASIGRAEVPVVRRLKVAFFSTGDELCGIGQPLGDGQIYDSNRYTLYGMLKRIDADILDLGIIPDQPERVEEAFQSASQQADVLITSGGVSVGDADYVKQTLDKLGQVGFWKIAIKPGRPLAFGHIGSCHFFGLPGNPVSSMVTFYQLVLPALKKMSGTPQEEPFYLQARCETALKKTPGRMDFQRGILHNNGDGELTVRSTGGQGSDLLSSMGKANCFIILPLESSGIAAGEMVKVQPFAGLI